MAEMQLFFFDIRPCSIDRLDNIYDDVAIIYNYVMAIEYIIVSALIFITASSWELHLNVSGNHA